VLLKNDNAVLPLKTSDKVVVVGGYGNDVGAQCGGWTVGWKGGFGARTTGTTIFQGFQEIGGSANVTYSQDGNNLGDASAVVVVIGEPPNAESGPDDIESILQGRDLVDKCAASGKPVVLVLICARPLIITDLVDKCKAVVVAWQPGTEGDGVAEVFYNKYPFTGKLNHTWPASQAQEPINEGDGKGGALYPLYHGLSY
jgi:beta-glucosidase